MVPIPMVINSKSGNVPKIITKNSTIQIMGTTSEFFFFWLLQHSLMKWLLVYDGTAASAST